MSVARGQGSESKRRIIAFVGGLDITGASADQMMNRSSNVFGQVVVGILQLIRCIGRWEESTRTIFTMGGESLENGGTRL